MFLAFFFFFFLKQECIVFSPLEEKLFPLHKVHTERTQENSYPSYIFWHFVLHSSLLFFFFFKERKSWKD